HLCSRRLSPSSPTSATPRSLTLFSPYPSVSLRSLFFFFFFNDTAPPEISTLSLHDALPTSATSCGLPPRRTRFKVSRFTDCMPRSEEHTSELQSLTNLVCRLLLEKKKKPT